jgi:chitin disaccharide deacetylase
MTHSISTKLIVNSDEFGAARSINEAIHECYKAGVLRSATLVCGGKAFDDAVVIANREDSLGVGVHFYLTDYVPCASLEKVASLIDFTTGRLYNVSTFLKRYFLGKIKLNEIQVEINAQIAKATDSLKRVTHVDGHNNLHVLPEVFKMLISTMKYYGLTKLRMPRENLSICDFRQPVQYFIKSGIYAFSTFTQKGSLDCIFPSAFRGLAFSGRVSKRVLLRYIRESIQYNSMEIMVHPAAVKSAEDKDELDAIFGSQQEFVGSMVSNYQYNLELQALTDPEVINFVNSNKDKLHCVNYGDL